MFDLAFIDVGNTRKIRLGWRLSIDLIKKIFIRIKISKNRDFFFQK